MDEKSFIEIYRNVCNDLEIECFEKSAKPFIKELCLIIAEVLALKDDFMVKIAHEALPAKLVAEVYSQLTNEHIKFVYDSFCDLGYSVKNKKAYLRTMLYNVVFEFSGHWLNQLNTDLKKEGGLLNDS